ncbi:hypothetical protein BDN72DRAFT_963606 [Pluteus cervinus]|uniref:Uncharacterized protein n=1 Tax=Pluteus cervinus TaxID=181527 RepID=A0ACD3AE90_9AGAR|nr:hypothetical protein BDN72DRAFT_963606 [Pluteus cervinus]
MNNGGCVPFPLTFDTSYASFYVHVRLASPFVPGPFLPLGLWMDIAILLKPSNTGDERTNIVAARFYVPCRPHLFGKPAPTKLYLSRTALEADEVFLMLTFIYSEARRQDRTSSSSDMGW